MTVAQLVVLALIAFIIGRLKIQRANVLLVFSALILYWLQPDGSFARLAFWLPTMTLLITVSTWLSVSAPEARGIKQNWLAAAILIGAVILVDLNRYFGIEQLSITPTPRVQIVAVVLCAFVISMFALARRTRGLHVLFGISMAIFILIVLIALKTPSFSEKLTAVLAAPQNHRGEKLALSWLGFSYISFRLLHTLLDYRAGRLKSFTLAEYVNYVIFFPALAAGPIDRIERFVQELNSPIVLDKDGWIEAWSRFFLGLFKKFVLADMLGLIAINDSLVFQVHSGGWLWLFLYAYALQIYFDFSGYTDMAIGLGMMLGVRLPENFATPYFKTNLAQFWNSWHISLTQWFRSYFFNPLTRKLRSAETPLPVWLIILVTQISTMALIGLWHGVTMGFLLWGMWHGIGLFIQNRWSDFTRNRLPAWSQSGFGPSVLSASGIFLTFNFVSLGWLFFTLSTPALAWTALLKLFGVIS